MLSNASEVKCPSVCTCGSCRWPHAEQYSPSSGAPQFAHVMATTDWAVIAGTGNACVAGSAAGSVGLTTGTWDSLIDRFSCDVEAGHRRRAGVRFRLHFRGELVRLEIIDVDDLHDLAIVVAQHGRFGFGNDAGRERLRDLARHVESIDLAGLDAFDADA